jgi:hypothetical protein
VLGDADSVLGSTDSVLGGKASVLESTDSRSKVANFGVEDVSSESRVKSL